VKPSPPTADFPPGRFAVRTLAVLLLPLLFIGCGNKKNEGIEAVFLADFSNTNVGDSDGYSDAFLNPNDSTITVGVKSVKLIKAGETSPSYTVFENADPLILDLTTAAQSADTNPVFPPAGDYSKVQVELAYVDFQVPVYDNDTAIDRRFRYYTLDSTDPDLEAPVKSGDVLVGDISSSPHFSWIDTADGAFVPLTELRPTVPLQVPASRFPNDVYASVVTMDLPSFLNIPDKPKGIITVTLTLHAGNLFFYDETETDTTAPAYTRFDRFTDGRLDANEPDSHFYPIFPAITATAE
jgi:hypothetical protein